MFGADFDLLYEISLMETDVTADWDAFQRKDLFQPKRHQEMVSGLLIRILGVVAGVLGPRAHFLE